MADCVKPRHPIPQCRQRLGARGIVPLLPVRRRQHRFRFDLNPREARQPDCAMREMRRDCPTSGFRRADLGGPQAARIAQAPDEVHHRLHAYMHPGGYLLTGKPERHFGAYRMSFAEYHDPMAPALAGEIGTCCHFRRGAGRVDHGLRTCDQLRHEDRITVVTKDPKPHFVPLEPLGRSGLARPRRGDVRPCPVIARKRINFHPVVAERLHPEGIVSARPTAATSQ